MKTVKLEDFVYMVFKYHWEDIFQKDMERIIKVRGLKKDPKESKDSSNAVIKSKEQELVVRKFVRDFLIASTIEIDNEGIEISKPSTIEENEDIYGGFELDIEDFKQVLNDLEIKIPKYTVFYYETLIYKDRVDIDYKLKSFTNLKDAEVLIKDVYYDKKDYALLLKGLDIIIYKLVLKDKNGKSEILYRKHKVSRDKKLHIIYSDDD